MKIAVIGTGYVGLVSGTCFAELGHHVTCIDTDKSKIDALKKGKIPIYEPDLEALVVQHSKNKRLKFTTQLKEGLEGAEVVFIAVGTPTNPKDGSADLSWIYQAARDVAPLLQKNAVVVTKSTVPVGTANKIRAVIYKTRGKKDVFVASNPEFLREGCAVKDFLEPDRVIIGVSSNKAEQKLRQLYLPITGRGIPLICTDTQTSELTKYAANGFLATKIAFINEMADLCEKAKADVEVLAQGMGLDPRIGRTYLKAGPGFGGSCFPKDTRALKHIARSYGAENHLIPAVIESNEQRKHAMAEKIIAAMGGSVKGKTIGILGLTFKANTDDMRESASLVIVPALVKVGANLKLFDPEGMEQAKLYLFPSNTVTSNACEKYRFLASARNDGKILWCDDMEDALAKVDAAVILTEWQMFSTIDWRVMKKRMKQPIVIDMRNLFAPLQMAKQGITYYSIGRSTS
jgi:UDPglucose 6-dehydrogenase